MKPDQRAAPDSVKSGRSLGNGQTSSKNNYTDSKPKGPGRHKTPRDRFNRILLYCCYIFHFSYPKTDK